MRIVQLLPTISYGDAIGNNALSIKEMLKGMGFNTQIYAENIDPRLPEKTAEPFSNFPDLLEDDVIIYHASTGTILNFLLPRLNGRKIMIYHNITPPEFLEPYSFVSSQLCADGLKGVRYLAGYIKYCLVDSDFNKNDLRQMGYTCPIEVCPILISFGDYEKGPSKLIMRSYGEDGYTNLLFTGRIAPNKKQEDIIRTFYYYHNYYNPKSRLILVGSWSGMERYYNRLYDYVQRLCLSDYIVFTGHIKFEDILAYYRVADLFVCMSEHEGFCVPLVEAMNFGLPIVAYNSSAVPETLGGSGILLSSKEPKSAAAVIHRVMCDSSYYQSVVAQEKERLKVFSYEGVLKQLKEVLRKFLNREELA